MKRAVYLDVIRVFACIMIIGVHVSGLSWGAIEVDTIKWQSMNFFDCFSIIGVPLFFMLSGAIYLNEEYQITVKNLFLKKILHLFIIYHFWLTFYNFIPFFRGELLWTYENINFYMKQVLMGHGIYHLWFLPELMLLYCITPIIKEAFQNKKTCEYFLILFAITGCLLPMLLKFTFPYKIFLESYYERTDLVMLTGYLGYYVLGHYVHSFVSDYLEKKKLILLALMVVLNVVLISLICGQDAIKKGQPSEIVNTPFTILHFFACFAIFTLAKNCLKQSDVGIAKMCNKIGSLTLGIYLMHPIILETMKEYGITTIDPHPIIMIPVYVVSIFICVGLVTFIFSKIPFVRKLVM